MNTHIIKFSKLDENGKATKDITGIKVISGRPKKAIIKEAKEMYEAINPDILYKIVGAEIVKVS